MAGQAELQIILKARDQASKVMESAGKAGSKAGQAISQHWKAASVALAGAGLALEGLARAQAESTKTVEQLGARLGITNEAIREMALDLSNVTFPLEDVLGLMELGTQAGLDSREALMEYANFWDTVADATDLSATELGKAGIALKAVGIAAGEEQKAIAAFGFITEQTSGSVGEFLQFIDKTGPELRAMGLDINDTAAFLGAMEKELGLTGRTARTEFKEALEQNVGDLKAAMVQIGLTSEQVAKYRGQVELSSDVIARNAQIHADSFTPIQKMQTALKDLAFEHAGAVKAAANFAPLLIAAGPAAKIAQVGIRGLSVGLGLLRTAFAATRLAALSAWAAMTGPVGLAVLAIVAAIGGILAAFVIFRDQLGDVFEFVGKAVSGFVNLFIDGMNLVIDAINVIPGVTIKAIREVNFEWRGAGEAVGRFAESATKKLGEIKDSILGIIPGIGGVGDAAEVMQSDTTPALRAVKDEAQRLDDVLAELTPRVLAQRKAMFDTAVVAFELEGAVDASSGAWDRHMKALDEGVQAFAEIGEELMLAEQNLQDTAKAFRNMVTDTEDAAVATSTWVQGIVFLNDELELASGLFDTIIEKIDGVGDAIDQFNEFITPQIPGGVVQTTAERLVNALGGFPIHSATGEVYNNMAELIAGLAARGTSNVGTAASFATGGVVGGPIGAPVAAIVHGGETIIPVGGRRGGKIEITINVHGTGGAAFESEVSQALRNVVRKGGFDGLLGAA